MSTFNSSNYLEGLKSLELDERNLLSSLFAIPLLDNLEGWLYNYFYKLQTPIIPGSKDFIGNPPFYKREFLDDKYLLSKEEVVFFNNGEILKELDKLYGNFHSKLRNIHLEYGNNCAFELLKTYAHCVYWLKDYSHISPFMKGKIENVNLDWSPILSFVKKHTDELISELDWRMNRLNPNNYRNYNPSDQELKMYFKAITVKGFKLIDEQKFKSNFEQIYNLLVPTFFYRDTTVEELDKLFRGNSQLFPSPVVWVGNTNTLSYFLRKLHDKHKLSKNTFFKTAEKLIAGKDGKLFENLKNSRSHPKNDAEKIDSIIDLF
ncbi:hypothetical protein [Flagellimonas sp.]|uniref:hypothetical protein n=1 Tax=Flagellimonas sp. TaxID=2058762 RepID=UPI003BAD5468